MIDAIGRVIADERLPAAYVDTVERCWRPLAVQLRDWREEAGRPIVVGVNGPQGSGKSTMCRILAEALLPELGLTSVRVSLDDFYLPRAARERLAVDFHPLFRTRGVPGTHDVGLGMRVLAALADGQPVRLPRFSKADDDRVPPDRWPLFAGPADVILFEGWCIGAPPQQAEDLLLPTNALERDEDPSGTWRRTVNDALEGPYAGWFAMLDRLILLKVPSFDAVRANRELQEAKLRARPTPGRAVMTPGEVRRFVDHYERLTRHMMDRMLSADAIFDVDAERHVTRLL